MHFVSNGDAETIFAEYAEKINEKEPKIFKGTVAEWNELTEEEKASYDGGTVIITDDEGTDNLIVDSIIDGDTSHAPSSNAIYDRLSYVVNGYYFNADTAHASNADYRAGLVSALNGLGIQVNAGTQIITVRYNGGFYASFVVMTTFSNIVAKILTADETAFESQRFTINFSNGVWS